MADAKKPRGEDFIGTGTVAELLEVSEGRVRQLALAGELPEAFRLGEGSHARRVYRRADVLAFKRRRSGRRTKP